MTMSAEDRILNKEEKNQLIQHKCFLCGFETSNSDSLDSHMESIHKKNSENVIDILCELCVFMTTSVTDMESHIEENHKDKDTNKEPETGIEAETETETVAETVVETETEVETELETETDKACNGSNDTEKNVLGEDDITESINCNSCEFVSKTSADMTVHVYELHQP